MKTSLFIVFGFALLTNAVSSADSSQTTHVVCPTGATDKRCAFAGNTGIQAAIDRAKDGDTVLITPGVYASEAYRDVRYKQYVIRGFVVVDRKRLRIKGEPGAVLDGATLKPASAIVVNGGDVSISGLTIRNFRAAEEEDDLYDGHGIFIIDAKAAVRDVVIERYKKMALTARGSSDVSASDIRIQDGHVAVWLEESAHLRLCNSVIRRNDSAGIAAYVNAVARVYNSVLESNLDDALYATGEAGIFATNSLLLGNRPYAARVLDTAQILVRHSVVFGNEKESSAPENRPQVKLGEAIVRADPKVGTDYRRATPLPGDPDVRDPAGQPSSIGLQEIAACAR